MTDFATTFSTIFKDGVITSMANISTAAMMNETDPWNMTTPAITRDGSFNQNTSGCFFFKFIISFIIMGLLIVLGLIGNCLSIMVLWGGRDSSAPSFLLISLATVDNGLLLTRFLLRSLPGLCEYFDVCGDFNEFNKSFLKAYGWTLSSLFHMMSIWVTVHVTINRFIVVCYPHKATTYGSIRTAKLQVLGTVIATILFNIPRLFEYKVVSENGVYKSKQTALLGNRIYEDIYKITLFYLVYYIIPLFTLSYLTYRLIMSLKEAKKRRERMISHSKKEDDITITLLAVVVVFIVCQIFAPFRRIIVAFIPAYKQACPYFYFYYRDINTFVVSFNSAINFVLYMVFGKRFRRNLINRLRRARVAPDRNVFVVNDTNTGTSGQTQRTTEPTPGTATDSRPENSA